jgi:hypothetical protein
MLVVQTMSQTRQIIENGVITVKVRRCLTVLPVVILAITTLGCGDGRVPVKGVVTFDGKPIEDGVITFEPADGCGPATGGQIIHGKYQLVGKAGMLPGKKTVRIAAARKTGRKIPVQFAPSGTMIDEVVRYIPDIYNTKTMLFCEVMEHGANEIDFALKQK